MKILSWNLLAPEYAAYSMKKYYGFDNMDHNNRFKNIKFSIEQLSPDIICLQEVTEKWMKELEQIGNIKYTIVSKCIKKVNKSNKRKVGTLILVRDDSNIKFKKQRKRERKYAYNYITLKYKNKSIYITNGHYRWGNTTYESVLYVMNEIKETDPKFYQNLIKKNSCAIICGDFNCSDINKELQFPCKSIKRENNKVCNINFEKALIPRYEYQLCHQYFTNFSFNNSKFSFQNYKNFYTSIKNRNANKDHDDKLYLKNLKIKKIYYGDFITKFNKQKTLQDENGLLYIKYNNPKRHNWKQIQKNLTSDHRWIMGIITI